MIYKRKRKFSKKKIPLEVENWDYFKQFLILLSLLFVFWFFKFWRCFGIIMFLCGEVKEEREIKRKRKRRERDQKVAYNSRSQIYNKQNKNDTKKRKSVLFCLCLVRNGTKKTGRNGIGIGMVPLLFFPIMRQENSFVAHKRQKQFSFFFLSSLLQFTSHSQCKEPPSSNSISFLFLTRTLLPLLPFIVLLSFQSLFSLSLFVSFSLLVSFTSQF